jgi:hypothetical protein
LKSQSNRRKRRSGLIPGGLLLAGTSVFIRTKFVIRRGIGRVVRK